MGLGPRIAPWQMRKGDDGESIVQDSTAVRSRFSGNETLEQSVPVRGSHDRTSSTGSVAESSRHCNILSIMKEKSNYPPPRLTGPQRQYVPVCTVSQPNGNHQSDGHVTARDQTSLYVVAG